MTFRLNIYWSCWDLGHPIPKEQARLANPSMDRCISWGATGFIYWLNGSPFVCSHRMEVGTRQLWFRSHVSVLTKVSRVVVGGAVESKFPQVRNQSRDPSSVDTLTLTQHIQLRHVMLSSMRVTMSQHTLNLSDPTGVDQNVFTSTNIRSAKTEVVKLGSEQLRDMLPRLDLGGQRCPPSRAGRNPSGLLSPAPRS